MRFVHSKFHILDIALDDSDASENFHMVVNLKLCYLFQIHHVLCEREQEKCVLFFWVNHCISLVKLQRKILEDFSPFIKSHTIFHLAKSQLLVLVRFCWRVQKVFEFKAKWNEDNFVEFFFHIFSELKSYDVADIRGRKEQKKSLHAIVNSWKMVNLTRKITGEWMHEKSKIHFISLHTEISFLHISPFLSRRVNLAT